MSSLTLNLPPELQQRIEKEAASQSISVPDYAARLLIRGLDSPLPVATHRSDWRESTPEQRADDWTVYVLGRKQKTEPGSPIPDEALRRENMYEDRGL